MRYAYLLVIAIAVSACVSPAATGTVTVDGIEINVEIADTHELRQTGLMHRTTLEENSGMLFVFPDSQVRSFWMKNTLIPLDILFIDEDGTIIDIQQMEPCREISCPHYISSGPSKFALEVNKGFAEANGIRVGDIAFIN